MKLFEKENKKSKKNSNKGQGTTQNQMIVNDLSNRAGGSGSGLSGLSRGNSQFQSRHYENYVDEFLQTQRKLKISDGLGERYQRWLLENIRVW